MPTRIPVTKRKSEWNNKANQRILLGYIDLGYRVLVNNRVIVTCHASFVDETIRCIELRDDMEEEDDVSKEPNTSSQRVEDLPEQGTSGSGENSTDSFPEKEFSSQEPVSEEIRISSCMSEPACCIAEMLIFENNSQHHFLKYY